jgi:cellulose synthase (UDP-forming)
MKKQHSLRRLEALIVISVLSFISFSYIFVRLFLTITATASWYELLLTSFFLLAESLLILHGIAYMLEVFKVIKKTDHLRHMDTPLPPLTTHPSVDILIPSYKEPLDVLEKTLSCCHALEYPEKNVVLLDDTRYDTFDDEETKKKYKEGLEHLCDRFKVDLYRRPWRHAKAGIINDFLHYLQHEAIPKQEYLELSHKEKKDKRATPDYICIFDADQNPFPDVLNPLISIMEDDTALAFVQTPQHYTNDEENRVAHAAGMQQVVFYEFICEGKSLKNAMFCCGSNVLMRTKALLDVKGFDEASVTEDFATSLKLHQKGWKSKFFNTHGTFGMGPEDLGGYFTQQFRWAYGTVSLLKSLIKSAFTAPRSLTASQWFEYFISSSYYIVAGLAFTLFAIFPSLYILFNIPTYFADTKIYAAVALPYILATFFFFYWVLKKRQYTIRSLILGQFLIIISAPIFLKASISALLGIKTSFKITPKGSASSLPLHYLLPQIFLLLLNFVSVIWGINHILFEHERILSYAVSVLWSAYHVLIFSFTFYFNNPKNT